MRVIEANGFKETGRLRQQKRMRDESYRDLVHYDLLAEEYHR
jgi:RimJ/RimL family protein N-acetyltransferase